MREISDQYLFKWIADRPLLYGSVRSITGNGIGRIGGLFVSVIIAAQYGADVYTDTFYLIFAGVAFFLNFFQGTLELSFIPIYSEIRSTNKPEKERFLGSIFLHILILTAAIAILADLLIWIFAPIFLGDQGRDLSSLTIGLIWEMSPLIIGVGVSALFVALFNAERLFMIAGLLPFFPSLGIILFVFLLRKVWGIHALSFGLLFGGILQVCIIYLICKKKGFRLKWSMNSPYLNKILRIGSIQAFALFLSSAMPIFDRVIVSLFLREGYVTALENAVRLLQIPWSLATVGYINVFFSWWSSKSAESDRGYVNASFKKLFIFSSIAFIPLSLLLYWKALPIIGIVFGYGKYSDVAVMATSEVFGYYCLGYWAFMLRSILIRFYSSQQNIHSIGRAAMIDFFVHFLIIFLLIDKAGIATFGIATTGGYFISLGYLFLYYLKFKNNFIDPAP